MVPKEISDLANLIWPNWRELLEDGDLRTVDDILNAARRIHAAGYHRS